MSLNIGIIGLPNVGKSTTFNALTKAQNAEVASYPFCTIEPNRAIVPVPDERLAALADRADRGQVIHATIEFVDIAGLVQGASRGEGLGNQFLSQIRNVDAILHVVRCFEDENVAHVSGRLDPQDDIETIRTELALADLEQLERLIERLTSQVKGDTSLRPRLELARALRDHIGGDQPFSTFPERDSPEFVAMDRELHFLSTKPVIYLANVDEAGLTAGNPCTAAVAELADVEGAEVVALCAELESELIDLSDAERAEMLALVGLEESGLAKVIRESYGQLGLISFFTMNEQEVRAWTIPAGTKAPQAAGRIHTDFERGFIRAEVIDYAEFLRQGSLASARSAGELRSEGKDYIVLDGDLILFRFNV
ncbi:MAG: redox-regulated ATPase YchF [Anaerolineales bacterium]